MVRPSGLIRPRYSPLALKLKLACKGSPGVARFFPEANTIRKEFGPRFVAGMRHLVRLAAESVRNQPSRFTVAVPGLKSSIQSEKAPSSSFKPVEFTAENS